MTQTKIGFIGFGKMAEALWKGFHDSGQLSADTTYFVDHSEERASHISTRYGLSHVTVQQVIEGSDIILVCIKPQQLSSLLDDWPKDIDLSEKVIVSILAGTPLRTFGDALGDTQALVRVMPNTPALVGAGMTAAYSNDHVSDAQKQQLLSLLSSVGKVIEVDTEDDLDTVTGISGSGPAFYYRLAQQSIEVGKRHGLTEDQALALIAQTLIGAGEMLLRSGESPEALIQAVSSPNGTTVAGLDVFEETGLDEHMQQVVEAAIQRAKELGKGA